MVSNGITSLTLSDSSMDFSVTLVKSWFAVAIAKYNYIPIKILTFGEFIATETSILPGFYELVDITCKNYKIYLFSNLSIPIKRHQTNFKSQENSCIGFQ